MSSDISLSGFKGTVRALGFLAICSIPLALAYALMFSAIEALYEWRYALWLLPVAVVGYTAWLLYEDGKLSKITNLPINIFVLTFVGILPSAITFLIINFIQDLYSNRKIISKTFIFVVAIAILIMTAMAWSADNKKFIEYIKTKTPGMMGKTAYIMSFLLILAAIALSPVVSKGITSTFLTDRPKPVKINIAQEAPKAPLAQLPMSSAKEPFALPQIIPASAPQPPIASSANNSSEQNKPITKPRKTVKRIVLRDGSWFNCRDVVRIGDTIRVETELRDLIDFNTSEVNIKKTFARK